MPVNEVVQTAEMFRERALDAIDMVRYLQDFSCTVDFLDLAPVFRQPETLDQAAVCSDSNILLHFTCICSYLFTRFVLHDMRLHMSLPASRC